MVKASVWWHIDSCPVAPGYDPRLVGPTIESFLKEKGFRDQLTITAIGNLSETPLDVLQHISSSGIALKHVPSGCFQTETDLFEWTQHNPSPAAIILICDVSKLECLARRLYDMGSDYIGNNRYIVCLVHPRERQNWNTLEWMWKSFLKFVGTRWRWETLLEGSKHVLLQDKCSKSDWFCTPCNSGGQGFENFIKHLGEHSMKKTLVVKQEPEPPTTSTMVKGPPQRTHVFWDVKGCPLSQDYPPHLVVPRIVSALEKSGYSGPVTISAVGNLEHIPLVTLKKLTSTGITLEHASSYMESHIFMRWKILYPPPTTLMLICDHEHLERLCRILYRMHKQGYTILLAYPLRPLGSYWLWRSFLSVASGDWQWDSLLEVDNTRMTGTHVPQKKCIERGRLFCTVCSFYSQRVEDFIMHVKSEEHAQEVIIDESGMVPINIPPLKITSVLWHINSCPVPHGHPPCLVGSKIVLALEKSGNSGPVTITAVGNLEHTPPGLLKELASTGIALKHDLFDLESDLCAWKHHNPPPATLLLICGHEYLELVARTLYAMHGLGYIILLAYPQRPEGSEWLWRSFLAVVSKDWPWHSLLEGGCTLTDSTSLDRQMTSRLVLQDKCTRTVECGVCAFGGKSVENFIKHLRSEEHAQEVVREEYAHEVVRKE